MAVAAVGPSAPHLRRHVVAHRGSRGGPAEAQRPPPRRAGCWWPRRCCVRRGAGLGYQVVYRHDRAVDQARTEIAEQGPRIVEQMLSYDAESLVDDFARAQSLATDAYRPATDRAAAVRPEDGRRQNNEYWAVSSAVLSVEPDQAAMLMALQGQRGANANDLKFITATVRVDFDEGRRAVASGQPQGPEEAADCKARPNEPAPQGRPEHRDYFGAPTPNVAAVGIAGHRHRRRRSSWPSRSPPASSWWRGTSASDRTQERDASALTSVRDFMTAYTSLDPFHANDYADGILAHATGDFAKQFKERLNEIVIRVARARAHHRHRGGGGCAALERQRQRRRPGGHHEPYPVAGRQVQPSKAETAGW